MKPRLHSAIDLLLCHPESSVAEMMGVRLSTLRQWMRTEGFSEALRAREREQIASARRLAQQAVVSSAARLCQIVSDTEKADPKILLDVLKASNCFDSETEDPGAALAELVKLTRVEEGEDAGQP